MIYLRDLIRTYFDLEELQSLCFDLDIDFEELGPPGSKTTKVEQLIRHCFTNVRVTDLIAACQNVRPNVSWPERKQRYAEVELLGKPAKPLLAYEPETEFIPAGTFIMGSDQHEPEESPQHVVELSAFRIGLYPVTNEQFAHFIGQTGRIANKEMLWDSNQPSFEQLRHPVQGITWYDALAYCQWLSQETSQVYSLPNEAQWEKAARGNDGRLYPWGNEWQSDRCNHEPDLVTAVDAFPPQSPYGCYDMIGNIREWTTTLWGSSSQQPDPRYQYPWTVDTRDDIQAPSTTRRIYRGGHGQVPIAYRCSTRGAYLPERSGPRRNRHGFRVIRLINAEEI